MKPATLRRYALGLPEATESPHFESVSFRVRSRIFATVPPGWGFVHVFVSSAVREEMLASHPEATEPLTWGGRVVGVRIDLGAAPASLVKSALRRAWMAKAPASLAATLESGPE